MCHTSSYRINYQGTPIRNLYHAHQSANTYWRIKFEINGVLKNIVVSYNNSLVSSNYMNQVQVALNTYNIQVETITLKIPGPYYYNTPTEIVIANQRDFLRALTLIPHSAELYSPERGVEAYINKDKVADKKYQTDSGYNSETSNQ